MTSFGDKVVDFAQHLQQKAATLPTENEPPHKAGGGDGGGMEARITKLEVHMDHMQKSMVAAETRLGKIEDRVGKVETTLATLVERVAHLPSKGFIITTVLGTGGLLACLIIFADNIRKLIGG